MASDDTIKVEGRVVEVLPNTMFWVELANRHRILAYVARRIQLDCQRLATGDIVKVQVSPFDFSKGCIISCGK